MFKNFCKYDEMFVHSNHLWILMSFLLLEEEKKQEKRSKIMLVKSPSVQLLSHDRLFATPLTVHHRLLRPWDFPAKSTGRVATAFLTRNTD